VAAAPVKLAEVTEVVFERGGTEVPDGTMDEVRETGPGAVE